MKEHLPGLPTLRHWPLNRPGSAFLRVLPPFSPTRRLALPWCWSWMTYIGPIRRHFYYYSFWPASSPRYACWLWGPIGNGIASQPPPQDHVRGGGARAGRLESGAARPERTGDCLAPGETTAVAPTAALVTAVYQRTEGHPFFLTEVLRLLATAGSHRARTILSPPWRLPVPQRVRDVVSRRLQALSVDCQQLLSVARLRGATFACRWSPPLPSRPAHRCGRRCSTCS